MEPDTSPDASGAESYESNDGCEARIGRERRSDPLEGIRVHEHVGVHEQHHVSRRPRGTPVAGLRRSAAPGRADDDDFVGSGCRCKGLQAALERLRRIRGGNDHRDGRHMGPIG